MKPNDLFLSFLLILSNSFIAGSQVTAPFNISKHGATGALLPVPQNVSFKNRTFRIDDTWAFTSAGIDSKMDPAIQILIRELKDRFSVRIKPASAKSRRLIQL